MNLFNVTNNRTINLDKVRAYDRTESGTRIYIGLTLGIDFVDSPIPYDTFNEMIRSKTEIKSTGNEQMARDIRQLALYQAIPTP